MDIKLSCYRVTHEQWFEVFFVQDDASAAKVVIVEYYKNSMTI